jgi:hypothetical protein
MNNDEKNAYMREWNREHRAAMTPEEKVAYNAKKCAYAKKHLAANPIVRVLNSQKTRRSLVKRLSSLTPDELAEYRARKWEREKRRLESPEARAARRAAGNRYSKAKYQKISQYQKDFKVVLRAEMVAAYGGSCVCCGEDEPVFLTLDHINGDGAAERKAAGNIGGYSTYLKLKKQGWPQSGYQVLCYNCNCAKRISDECPHRLIVKRKLMLVKTK